MGFAAIALLSFEPKSRVGLGFGLLSSDSAFFYNTVSILIGCVVLFLLFIAGFSA